MKSFNEYFLTETFKNLFIKDKDARLEYADQVWNVLQISYKRIGGIKGNGFKNKEDMIANIPFWKLNVKDGKVIALIMYKDAGGRKSVAAGTNKTPEGKAAFKEMVGQDFARSFGEKSGPMLAFLDEYFPEAEKKWGLPAEQAIALITKAKPHKAVEYQLIPGEKYLFKHLLSGEWIEKKAFGTPGKPIV